MLNYIHSELYRLLRSKAFRGLLIFCSAILVILAVIASLYAGSNSSLSNMNKVSLAVVRLRIFNQAVIPCMVFGIIAFVVIFPALIRKGKGIHIQLISFGLRRHQVFFGDMIVMALTMLMTAVLLFLEIIVLSTFLFWAPDAHSQFFGFILNPFFLAIVNYYLICLSLCALCLAFYYLLDNAGWVNALTFILVGILPFVLINYVTAHPSLTNNLIIKALLLPQPLRYIGLIMNPVYGFEFSQEWKVIEASVSLFVLANIMGYLSYRKKEI